MTATIHADRHEYHQYGMVHQPGFHGRHRYNPRQTSRERAHAAQALDLALLLWFGDLDEQWRLHRQARRTRVAHLLLDAGGCVLLAVTLAVGLLVVGVGIHTPGGVL
jgi:hypothetical protein